MRYFFRKDLIYIQLDNEKYFEYTKPELIDAIKTYPADDKILTELINIYNKYMAYVNISKSPVENIFNDLMPNRYLNLYNKFMYSRNQINNNEHAETIYKKIPPYTGRPVRDISITPDEIINLIIELNCCQAVDEFIDNI